MMVFLQVKYLQGFKETAVTKSIKQLLLERGRLLGLAAFIERHHRTGKRRRRGDIRVGDQNYAIERRLCSDHRRGLRARRRHRARDGCESRQASRAGPEQGERRKSRGRGEG